MYATPSFSFHAKPRNKMCSISISLLMFLVTQLLCFHTHQAIPVPSQSHSKFSREPALGLQAKLIANTPDELFDQSLNLSLSEAQSTRALAHNLSISSHNKANEKHLFIGGMSDCIELLDDSLDQLYSIMNHKAASTSAVHSFDDDVQTWLSAALTNQQTCLESLGSNKSQLKKEMLESKVKKLSDLLTNSLALYVSTKPKKENYKATKSTSNIRGNGKRRLLSYHNSNKNDNFPRWVSPFMRKLLEASVDEIKANAVVDKHGSGTHRTIGEAIEVLSGEGQSVIHIKAGVYNENLKFSSSQKNVVLVGDGKGKTVIVGSRSSAGGWTTFASATVAVMGDGFIARDITFVNSAGPAKHQAVALRIGSDKSVVFRCSILGYQDTLYTLSKRQFYRDTDIYGTVDFIFGNSAVVFQNCNIYARKPSGENNFVTAQGRSNPNQNTGISIHNCRIQAASDLAPVKSKVATYLGRPWKQYSRTVIMQSFLDDSIHPSGWSPWSGNFALKTLFYGEYLNSGPGSSISRRVTWPGYKGSLTSAEAQAFTVAALISGNLWLPSTGVEFDSGLIG